MAMLVHEDPSVLSQDDMVLGVNNSLLDASTMVHEETVNKFMLRKSNLIDNYYMMLKRILVSCHSKFCQT